MKKLAFLVFLGTMMAFTAIYGQGTHASFYEQSLHINNAGMMVLGSWALANITIGAIGWSRNSGQSMYFHQMNLFWNVVNLSIAGIALYSNYHADYSALSPGEILDKQLGIQRLFLINAGLDMAYMGTGYLLKRLAPKYPKNETRLTGYGHSVMLQGAFLFVFDLVMFGIQRSHRLDFMEYISLYPMKDAWGLACSVTI